MGKLILIASLVANVVLAAFVWRAYVPDKGAAGETLRSASPANTETVAAQTPSLETIADQADLHSRLATLRQAGLSERQIKIQLLHEIRVRELAAGWQNDPVYWTSDAISSELLALQTLGTAHQRIRGQVENLFGSEAYRDEVFFELYHPLALQHGYLPWQQQWALQEFQVREQLAFMTRQSPPDKTELLSALGAEWLFEFQLRSGAIAQQVRSTRLDFTESEFRETVRLYDTIQQQAQLSQFSQLAHTRSEIEQLLGEDRALLLRIDMEPSLRAVARAATAEGLSRAQMLRAVSVITTFEAELVEAHDLARLDQEGSRNLAAQLVFDRDSALSNIVGEELAKKLIQARRSAFNQG